MSDAQDDYRAESLLLEAYRLNLATVGHLLAANKLSGVLELVRQHVHMSAIGLQAGDCRVLESMLMDVIETAKKRGM